MRKSIRGGVSRSSGRSTPYGNPHEGLRDSSFSSYTFSHESGPFIRQPGTSYNIFSPPSTHFPTDSLHAFSDVQSVSAAPSTEIPNHRAKSPSSGVFLPPRGRAPRSVARLQYLPSPYQSCQVKLSKTNTSPSSQSRRNTIITNSQTLRTPRTGVTNRLRQENVVVALVNGRGIAKNEVGMAAVNLTSSELDLCQMNDSHGFVKTITKLNIYRPSELIVPDTLITPASVSPLIEEVQRLDPDISIVAMKRSAFTDAGGLVYIKQLAVDDHQSVLHLVDQKYYALAAAAALMSFLEVERNISYAPKTLRVYYQGSEATAIVDSETAHRLELVSSLHQLGGPSLMSSLNYCQTAAGSRLLRSNILEPLTNWEKINQRLDAIEELTNRPTELLDPIKNILARFVDVDRAVNQCILIPKSASASFLESRINAIIGLKHILALVAPLRSHLSKANNPLMRSLALTVDKTDYETVLSCIHQMIDDQTKTVKGRIGMLNERCRAVKPRVNDMLDFARHTYRDMVLSMEDYAEELSKTHMIGLTLVNSSARDFHLQMPYGGQKTGIPALPRDFICVKKHAKHIAMTTEELLVKNERLKVVLNDIHKITNTVIEELLVFIRQHIGCFFKLRDAVSQLDVVVSLAQVVAHGVGFCRPQLADSLIIQHGRHPILNRFGETALVSNDTEMTAERNVHIITGANMSGKSTYIRQVFLLQIMAQIGSFVPASSASVRIFDQLFSRVGMRDSLETNASSFTKEMMEMNYIVRNAGHRSLVIIDELCKETSVDEGSAICWAFCEALVEAKAWLLVATHNTLVSKMEHIYFNVVNYNMEVVEEAQGDEERVILRYTHQLKPGVMEVEDYAMKLAALAGLPALVMERARQLVPIVTSAIKPNPTVPLQFRLNKLYYSFHLRLRQLGHQLDALSDDEFLEQMARIRDQFARQHETLFPES